MRWLPAHRPCCVYIFVFIKISCHDYVTAPRLSLVCQFYYRVTNSNGSPFKSSWTFSSSVCWPEMNEMVKRLLKLKIIFTTNSFLYNNHRKCLTSIGVLQSRNIIKLNKVFIPFIKISMVVFWFTDFSKPWGLNRKYKYLQYSMKGSRYNVCNLYNTEKDFF